MEVSQSVGNPTVVTTAAFVESKNWKEYYEKEEEEDEDEDEEDEDEDEHEDKEQDADSYDFYRAGRPSTITREVLEDIERELGLIQLCWPEKDLGEDDYLSTLPDSYCTVSDKERLLLWHAENFRKQFHFKYKDRKPLLLACENECGMQVRKR
ncbi:hypothetical protein KPH14_002188 [Odynerus spinipes]|uniref:Uncharacterized protein n=1 Tax=Odynerus spinipes TaxID=1348599 RepID=A0AAD9VNX1_9HYME|nr:hypothetical protein KPH14_002188 [Odynerus spinipes]